MSLNLSYVDLKVKVSGQVFEKSCECKKSRKKNEDFQTDTTGVSGGWEVVDFFYFHEPYQGHSFTFP